MGRLQQQIKELTAERDGLQQEGASKDGEKATEVKALLQQIEELTADHNREFNDLEASNGTLKAALPEQNSEAAEHKAGLEAQVAELKKELAVLQGEMRDGLQHEGASKGGALGGETIAMEALQLNKKMECCSEVLPSPLSGFMLGLVSRC